MKSLGRTKMNLKTCLKVKESEASGRIQKWDILKFFLIFLVVLGHFCELYMRNSENLQILRYWIYSFHMPLFIFVTGLFAKKNINEKRYSKISVFLMIYFVTNVFLAVCNAVTTGKVSFSLLTMSGVPWYGFAVFFQCLITIALRKLPRSYVFAASVALACMVGYDASIGDRLVLSRIIVFYPFFFAGYCLDVNKLGEFSSKLYVRIVSALLIAASVLIVYFKFDELLPFQPLLSARNPYSVMNTLSGVQAQAAGLYRLIWYAAAFLLCFCFVSLTPKRLDRRGFIARLGSRTLQVYILHYGIMCIVDGLFDIPYFLEHTTNQLLIPASVIITLLCSAKIFEKPIKYLTNPQSFVKFKAAVTDSKNRE